MTNKFSQELIIYCDESDSKGKYYSNFYGGLLVDSKNIPHVKQILDEKKIDLNLFNEVKWSKITENYKENYIQLIDTLFDLLEAGLLKIRVMFTQNRLQPNALTDYHHEIEIESDAHSILQCLDIVLGGIQFRLNDKHLEKPEGGRFRGKRTIAKEQVYKHINARIRKIYPGFHIGCTTSRREKSQNIWCDSYRHWCFKPKNHNVDENRGKNRTKKNPLSLCFSTYPKWNLRLRREKGMN